MCLFAFIFPNQVYDGLNIIYFKLKFYSNLSATRVNLFGTELKLIIHFSIHSLEEANNFSMKKIEE